ncbi:MAG: transposase [Rhodobacteraceae bacterium]|nr:transposase [Paracoccaceae bacterium]
MEIRILKKQGLSIRGIARELGISRETVRKYLRAPDREPVCTPRAARPSKLDAHKAFIRKRVTDTAPHRLPATVLLRELRARGYDGGITILKAFLAAERPVVAAPEIKRFETEPGYQAQIDWTPIRRGKDRLTAFVATLGFSAGASCGSRPTRPSRPWPPRTNDFSMRSAGRRRRSSTIVRREPPPVQGHAERRP